MNVPNALTLLKTHSLQTIIQGEIEKMILSGQLQLGEPLREVNLAESLGVSRGPVREALQRLEEKGLVTIVKNCGAYVRTLTLQEADQIYEIRTALEFLIGEKVAQSINKEGLVSLDKIIKQMELAVEKCDINQYSKLNLEYHDRLAELSGNSKLHKMYSRLVSELALFRRHTFMHDRNSMLKSLNEHEAIYRSVMDGNAELASELLKNHSIDSRKRLHEAIEGAA